MDPTETLPDFLTVEEAAEVLRIGRTTAYGLTRQWRVTGGESGLPVVRFGRQLRVPKAALEAFAGGPLAATRNGRAGETVHTSRTDGRSSTASRHFSDAQGRAEQLELFDAA